MNGEGIATEKYDGTCCLIQDNKLYKRYDAKQGKQPPEGAIPCQPGPDPITTHWPHWVEVKENKPDDKWYIEAWNRLNKENLENGTYELCGPHFQTNPYDLEFDIFIKHGNKVLDNIPRTFEGIKEYLNTHYIEGIVFYRENGEMCKIKRTDFGFIWNNKRSKR